MMASLRAKAGGGKRSGDGRECRLLPRQDPSTLKDGQRTTPSKTKATTTKVPSRTGHGAQAAAWNSSLHFEKSPQTTITSSSSTSPETDPGTSDVFPFFKGTRDDFAQSPLRYLVLIAFCTRVLQEVDPFHKQRAPFGHPRKNW